MRVVEVDPTDEQQFLRWYRVLEAAQRHDAPDDPDWSLRELRAVALRSSEPEAPERAVHLAVVDGGEFVGAARLDLPQRDNRHLALGELFAVHPDARRRGVGSALLDAVDAAAAADGRTDLLGEFAELPDRPAPGRGFALARGFACAQVNVRRDLDLPPDAARLVALEAACAPYADGYRVVTWGDRCPEQYVQDRALLARRMSTDAPLGDVPLQEEQWDAQRVRHEEGLLRAQGRQRLAAGAVHLPSGRLVAFTDLALPDHAPHRAFQHDTLVLREHRGHRLGTLVKIANLRQVAGQWPHTRVVTTWNAAENLPMIAVNDALGCRPHGTYGEWRRDVTRRA